VHFDDEGTNINNFNVCTNTLEAPFATGLTGGHAFANRFIAGTGDLVADAGHVSVANGGVEAATCDSSSPGAGGLFSLDVEPGGSVFAVGSFDNNKIDYMTTAHCLAGQASPDATFDAIQGAETSGLYGVAIFAEVSAAIPALTTLLSSSSISTGQSVTDNATLSSVSSSASGAITFYYGTLATCPNTGATVVGSPISVSGPGTYGPSASVTFSTAGTYYWYAVYDPGTSAPTITSPCEQLTVGTTTHGVPEFGAPAMLVAALGLLGVALLTRRFRAIPKIQAY
jgi:hypothetical protein